MIGKESVISGREKIRIFAGRHWVEFYFIAIVCIAIKQVGEVIDEPLEGAMFPVWVGLFWNEK